jgi:multidrug resistance efflux pump
MSASFPRTLRALQRDGMNPIVLGLIILVTLIGFWTCWLMVGRVSVFETSTSARLEVEQVQAVVVTGGGRIVASYLALGRAVRAGDVLLEIDADRESFDTAEERTRLDALSQQLRALDQEIRAEQEDGPLARRTGRIKLSQAAQNVAAAEAASQLADDEQRRLRQLSERGLVPQADLHRSKIQADSRRAELAATRLGIDRLRAEETATQREHDGHLRALIRQRVTLEGERATAIATMTRREWETRERQIRAPISGRVGDVIPLQVGAVIRGGDRVASIVPKGDLKIIAQFLPSALGRLRAGQSARLRLDGFPWAQYGHIRATVERVASETRDGRVRVELTIAESSSRNVALEHGSPGTVDIEIERVAPAVLLIRTLGGSTTVHARADAEPAAEHGAQ